MKNFVNLIGIIAIVAVIVFSMAACKEEEEDGGGGDGITLTNIPDQYNGNYAFFAGNIPPNTQSNPVYGAESMAVGTATLVQISNGSVTLPLWRSGSTYSGSDVVTSSFFRIYNTKNPPGDLTEAYNGSYGVVRISFTEFTFNNGKATISWNDGTAVPK